MKRVFVSHDSAEVGFLKNVLEDAGIACLVRNETQAFTSVFLPELWVVNDEDFGAAEELCRKWRRPGQEPGRWRCEQCAEEIESQFDTCWKCGAARGEAQPTEPLNQGEARTHEMDTAAAAGTKPFADWMVIILAILAASLELYWRGSRSGDPMVALHYPVDTALWYTGQHMMLGEGWKDVSQTAKRIRLWHDLYQEGTSAFYERALRDTIAFAQRSRWWSTNVTQLRANLVVLLGETGSNAKCARELEILSRDDNATSFVMAAHAVYETNKIASPDGLGDPTAVLGDTWFQKKFEARWLRLNGSDSESAALTQWLQKNASEIQRRDFAIICIATLAQVLGLFALVWLLLHRGYFTTGCPQALAVPWSGWEGLGIFAAAWALGIVLVGLLNRIGLSILNYFAYHLMAWAPLVLLLWRRHWRFDKSSLGDILGLRPLRTRGLWLIFAGLAVFSLDWFALGGVDAVARAVGLTSHWAERVYESEFYEPWKVRWMILLDGALITPIAEELAYRGVLFPALQKWMPVSLAALASAVLFAGSHYYSWPGILALIAFGFVSASATHLTRSLIPSIIGHVLTNLLLVAGYSWVLAA